MTLSYKRVLNPIDFDEHSIKATPVAAELARYSAGKIFLLHVVPMTLQHRGLSTTVDSHRSQGIGARARLEEIAIVHAEGTTYDLLTRLGDPAQEILKAAKQLAADVIVMTTHGRTGFSRALHGSVAEDVIREAVCSVLVVRHTNGEQPRMIGPRAFCHRILNQSDEDVMECIVKRMLKGRNF